MKNIDLKGHVTGQSLYLDDISIPADTLYALVFDSPVAHAKIIDVDYSKAEALEGVQKIITYKDIPGENQIGSIIPDEFLYAENEVHFIGMPVALIVANSEAVARKAKKLIEIKFEELPVIVDPREACKKNKLIFPPRTFKIGEPDNIWKDCEYIFEGRADSGGQEHLYLETQGAIAVPTENGSIKIYSSTQGPTVVQKIAARVLGIPMHKIEIDVTRLGGGFGGKEDQATVWGVHVALAAKLLNKPVKYSVHRMDDMRMTGKRHPYSSDYKIGLSKDLKIKAYKAVFYQNAGASADLSPAVMERTLFHGTNSYYIPNVELTAYSCKTNLPPNTAFRGFGGPQGMFVIESAVAHVAKEMGVSAGLIQEKNLLNEGNAFPYGQIAEYVNIVSCYEAAKKLFNINSIEKEIASFNSNSPFYKKGMAIQPICFGISFTNTPMNHARCLVHIYQDGSIGISSGGVEMGQGLNTKLVQVASMVLGVNPTRIKIETTNTTRVANTSPTAASATADLNGKALENACNELLNRLKEVAANILKTKAEDIEINKERIFSKGNVSDLTWEELIMTAHLERVCLSENGHYATPTIHFDKAKEKGHPFAYHVYGVAVLIVKLDCLRGIYEFESVKIVHDFGKSINTSIDIGQVEGALVQGIGWMTMEELKYNEKGRLLSNALSSYKIPDIYSAPKEIDIRALETEGNPMAIRQSKAVGEPPLMYGLGAYFAIQNAIRAFNPNHKIFFDAPFTPEKVLIALYE